MKSSVATQEFQSELVAILHSERLDVVRGNNEGSQYGDPQFVLRLRRPTSDYTLFIELCRRVDERQRHKFSDVPRLILQIPDSLQML